MPFLFLIYLLIKKHIKDTKAAPSLQKKCNELKRARLADDLNEKLAKRPGPLELVESGILVSNDSNLTEAIKHGKIVYPRTSMIITGGNLNNSALNNNRHHPYQRDSPFIFNAANLNDSTSDMTNLFNFTNLTDTDENSNASSQASSSTTKTTHTLNSMSSSSIASFNFNSLNHINAQLNTENNNNNNNNNNTNPGGIIAFGDIMSPYRNISSPASSTASSSIIKTSSSQNLIEQSANISTNRSNSINKSMHSLTSKKLSSKTSSFSSASSTTSSQSSSKTLKSVSSNPNGTSNSGQKKLIFHEYKGPNQKTSKTSINILSTSNNNTNNSSSKTLGKILSSASKIKSLNKSQFAAKLDKNDSSNNGVASSTNMNTEDDDNSMSCGFNDKELEEEELDPYRIRLEQQKMFLLLTENNALSTASSRSPPIITDINDNLSNSNQNSPLIRLDENNLLLTQSSEILPVQNQHFEQISNINIQPVQVLALPSQTSLNNSSVNNKNPNQATTQTTQIQIVRDLQNFQILDNIKTIFNNSNGNNNILPISCISNTSILSSSTSSPLNFMPQNQSQVFHINTEGKVITNAQSMNPAKNVVAPAGQISFSSLNANEQQRIIAPIQIEINQNQSNVPSSSSSSSIMNTSIQMIETDSNLINKLETMTMNQLRDECVKRRLPKNGIKQKLIERLKGFLAYQHQQHQNIQQQINHIKSPDSGVNMDSSPSFVSC